MNDKGWDLDREIRNDWFDFEQALVDAMGNLVDEQCLWLDLPVELGAGVEVGGFGAFDTDTDGVGEGDDGDKTDETDGDEAADGFDWSKGQPFVVDMTGESEGLIKLVMLCRDEDEFVVEVMGNRERSSRQRLSSLTLRRLRRLGLTRRSASSRYYQARFEDHEVYLAAEVAVEALRDIFGVMHPQFLVSDELPQLSDWRPAPVPRDRSRPPAADSGDDSELPDVIEPVDHDHLERLVARALEPLLEGPTPERDDDGDIGLVAGSTVVFVRVERDLPIVRVFCPMAIGITHADAAEHEVAELNRVIDGVKFEHRDDQVIAEAHVFASPFVPEHLRRVTAGVARVAAENDRLLAERTGGRTFIADENGAPVDPFLDADLGTDGEATAVTNRVDRPDLPPWPGSVPSGALGAADDDGGYVEIDCDDLDDAAHGRTTDGIRPEMMSLLQLDAGRPGALTPDDVARICHNDRDLLLELIGWNSEQEISWRESRDFAREHDDTDEADVCEIERAHAEVTISLLRETLRLVLLG